MLVLGGPCLCPCPWCCSSSLSSVIPSGSSSRFTVWPLLLELLFPGSTSLPSPSLPLVPMALFHIHTMVLRICHPSPSYTVCTLIFPPHLPSSHYLSAPCATTFNFFSSLFLLLLLLLSLHPSLLPPHGVIPRWLSDQAICGLLPRPVGDSHNLSYLSPECLSSRSQGQARFRV